MFVYLEAVNFISSIEDTNDISTIRGGSMLLEELSRDAQARLGGTPQLTGASKALLRFEGVSKDELTNRTNAFVASEPWRHVSLVFGVAETAEAAHRRAILSAPSVWTWPLPTSHDGKRADPEDLRRPANAEEIGKDGKTSRAVSAFTKLRRDMARKNRPLLYPLGRDPDDLDPPQSFEDIVSMSDTELDGLPPVTRGKLAIVAVDGIGVGRLAAKYSDTMSFSDAVTAYYDRLAGVLREWAWQEQLIYEEWRNRRLKVRGKLDVLMWGGDDMTFFMPARKVMSFVDTFMRAVAEPFDQTKGDHGFPHRIGVVTANHKVPFRQLRRIAATAESLVREVDLSDGSGVCIVPLESVAAPSDALTRHWQDLYGPGHRPEQEVFKEAEFRAFKELCNGRISDEDTPGKLSVTQVHRILQLSRLAGGSLVPNQDEPDDAARVAMETLERHYAQRYGEAAPIAELMTGIGRRTLPLLLAQVAQLKPYVDASFRTLPIDHGVEAIA